MTGDVDVATPVASPNGLVLNADGTVTLTTGAANDFAAQNGLTVINATNAAYNGFYKVISVTSNTVSVLAPQFVIPAGTGGSGGGSVAKNEYASNVRIEDISWQNQAAAGQVLDMRDRNGNIIWQATSTGAGQQNRGKVFWVSGITLFALPSGVVIVTVN